MAPRLTVSPSGNEMTIAASGNSRSPLRTIASKAGCESVGELLMTSRISEVAVCCSSDSVRSSVRWRNSLSSRAFSMAMTACAAKVLHQIDLLIGEELDLVAIDRDHAKQFFIFEHRHRGYRTDAAVVDASDSQMIAAAVGLRGPQVCDLDRLTRCRHTRHRHVRSRPEQCPAAPLVEIGLRQAAVQRGRAESVALAAAKVRRSSPRRAASRWREERSNTGASSPVELAMTLSTSEVAVCCSSDFAQLAEQPRVLDGDHGLRGEVLHQLDLLVGERPNLLPVNDDARRPARRP